MSGVQGPPKWTKEQYYSTVITMRLIKVIHYLVLRLFNFWTKNRTDISKQIKSPIY